jgi:hypothetical protein
VQHETPVDVQVRPSENLEQKYIVADADNRTAYVALQEANAIAVLDIEAATFTDVWPFGFKDHLDVSDRDGQILIENWPVFAMTSSRHAARLVARIPPARSQHGAGCRSGQARALSRIWRAPGPQVEDSGAPHSRCRADV